MSADRTDDGAGSDAVPGRPLRAPAGLDRSAETYGREGPVEAGDARDRAIGELAAENAGLYKRIGPLESKLKAQQARFAAWGGEVAARDDARAERDEARDRREEVMTDRISVLEARLAERPAADPGGTESRLGRPEPAGQQAVKRNPDRLWRTNEAIGVYVAGGGAVLTAAADAVGTSAAADVTGLAGTVLTFAAAAIALARKRREGSNADRPEG